MSGRDQVDVYGGVDTHRDTHVGAVVDATARLLGSQEFGAESSGYVQLERWLRSWGQVVQVGVEGTGSYGAGLARHLTAAGVEVVEVNRPNRQLRRLRGKTDTVDAEAAARAALSGAATARPKAGNGPVEGIRMLRVARRSGVKARTQAANQIHALVVTAPEQVKHQLRGFNLRTQVRICARWRPGETQTTTAYAKRALRHLARRYQTLDTEITQLDTEIRRLCARTNPALLAATGVGPDSAAALLVAAGDNPGRMNTEASFAALCALSPVQASSGRTIRHRLNRGGDRQANNALWRIATNRMRTEPRTIEYTRRRQAEGKTRREIIRCLKRHIAREIHHLLTNPTPTPHGNDLRLPRHQARQTLTDVAQQLQVHPTLISQLERGLHHNHQLATRYQQWLTDTTRNPICKT